MLAPIEKKFAEKGRTPKGREALRAVFRATRETVADVGLASASLDAIASRAGITQAALRHYFATRDELLTHFFTSATVWLKEEVAGLLADDKLPGHETLERCITWHLEFMEAVDAAFWFEGSGYWLRQRRHRRTRDDWYRWLLYEYAALIGRMHPSISRDECHRRAFLILTLVLGAWATHGRGSRVDPKADVVQQRKLLVNAAMRIAG